MEKQYFRLSSVSKVFHNFGNFQIQRPDSSTVRPESLLRKWLPILLQKWEDYGNYDYVCDQLKSIRQDITVIIGNASKYINFHRKGSKNFQ